MVTQEEKDISELKEMLEKHGTLSVPYIQRRLKCTQVRAIQLLNELATKKTMDHSLPLAEFIEKYRHTFKPVVKLPFKKRKIY